MRFACAPADAPDEEGYFREADSCAAGACGQRPCGWRARRPDRGGHVHRRHGDGRHQVRSQQRPGREEVPPETLGSGVAFLDANNDGWPDILLVNSKDWKPGARRSLHALYRNNKDGTFTNATAGSGLDVEMYGMGVAVGDYDNDGKDDVYITALEGDRLFHNEGNFKFRDVTKTSGIANSNFGTSAAWLDYDKDGLIDVYVANYVQWTEKGDIYCTLDGSTSRTARPSPTRAPRRSCIGISGAAGSRT